MQANVDLKDIISAARESAESLNALADFLEHIEKRCEELTAKDHNDAESEGKGWKNINL